MKYLNTNEIAIKWNISERSVRDYCNKGRVEGAILEGKSWKIPEDALKPNRNVRHIIKDKNLYKSLIEEKETRLKGGIYHRLQIIFTYNSNHIEGSKLSEEQTLNIFETHTIGFEKDNINIDDIIETTNHFRCVDYVIDSAKSKLTESFIKQLHYILKTGTSDSLKSWFRVGDYKLLENEVGGKNTSLSKNVKNDIQKLLDEYNNIENITVLDIIDFHYKFECIHPFQDGNGRVGRLIMLKECLKHNIVPILITDDNKYFYYRGLKEYINEKGYLIDTCLAGQDLMKKNLDYFKIRYND